MNLNLKDQTGDIYAQRLWFRNEAYIQSVWKDKYAIGGGLSHDYFEEKIGLNPYQNAKNYVNPYLYIKSDTQDDSSFPTRGFYMSLEGKILDLFNSETEEKIIQSKNRIKFHVPVSKIFTYSMDLFGGFTVNKKNEEYYKFGMGGLFEQNLGNYARMEGYEFGQIMSDNLLTATARLQFQVIKNAFVTGIMSIANHFDEINIENTFKINESAAGITAGYKSPFGQIKINYSKAFNKDNNGLFNVILGHWF